MKLQKLLLLIILLQLCITEAQAAPFVYVANSGDGTVTVIDTVTNTVVGSPITVGDTPTSIAITPDYKTAYVTNRGSNSVTPITLATNISGEAISIGVGTFSPQVIAITPDGTTAYVANRDDDSVVRINLVTNMLIDNPITVAPDSFGIAITPDGQAVYIAGSGGWVVTPIDTVTNIAGAYISVEAPQAIAITPDGKTAYVAGSSVDLIDIATDTVTLSIPVGSYGANAIAITPDGKFAYVSNSFKTYVSVIDLETNTVVVASIPIGTGPSGVAITPDSKTAYVTNRNSNTVTAIDIATHTAIATIPVGNEPWGIAITPLPFIPGPLNVTGMITQNTFLNRSDLVLSIRWQANPVATDVLEYRIFNNDIQVGVVSARDPLVFFVNVNQGGVNFSVASVTLSGIESHRNLVRVA